MRTIPGFSKLTLVVTALAFGAAATVGAQAAMTTVPAKSLVWTMPEIPGFDPGLKRAVVSGDPSVVGAPYVIRLGFPDGYKFPPHWHPTPENVTVLRGTLLIAMGEKRDDAKLQRYTVGDYVWIDAKHPHFGGAIGETVVQLHGTGPFSIEVVGLKK